MTLGSTTEARRSRGTVRGPGDPEKKERDSNGLTAYNEHRKQKRSAAPSSPLQGTYLVTFNRNQEKSRIEARLSQARQHELRNRDSKQVDGAQKRAGMEHDDPTPSRTGCLRDLLYSLANAGLQQIIQSPPMVSEDGWPPARDPWALGMRTANSAVGMWIWAGQLQNG
ncbi:hypothetical protein B0H10DRAFT_2189687 [Mycena sp. CBHHK59/15]|nr:hypothetical protein B0H10DRAFT_2189687 [Mycena sp. CBHHK59/15]